jgi:hypothetical protein
MVELGSVYSNIYDITITVLETVRGKEAMDRLKASSPDNGKPPKGFEYILARVKFEIKGRAVTDTLTFDLGNAPLQWVALSSDLIEYPQVSVTVPNPALVARIKPGDSMEGWVAFAVDRNDSKPVMVFDPDSGGATGRGMTLFFKLYSQYCCGKTRGERIQCPVFCITRSKGGRSVLCRPPAGVFRFCRSFQDGI